MKWIVQGASEPREVEIERVAGGFEVTIDGKRRRVDLVCLDGSEASLRFTDSNRNHYIVFQGGKDRRWRVTVGERELDLAVMTPLEAQIGAADAGRQGPSQIEAPIPGKVVAVKIKPGDEVEPGQALVVLEAMKMENELNADQGGKVAKVHVAPGDTVATGTLLVELE
jgi:biotin carboxyl carrier protein